MTNISLLENKTTTNRIEMGIYYMSPFFILWYLYDMNLQESIRRILREETNEVFTGDTPTDMKQHFINKPVKLTGDINVDTKIEDLNINKDGSVNIRFQNGLKLNTSIPMLREFNVGIDIPLNFKVKKKN